ncbi:MAG: NnrU family protein [Bauldia sp.]
MALLILGLILFLGTHSLMIAAPGLRASLVGRLGEQPFKGLYALLSLAGFVLIVIGFGQARADTVVLWNPPVWARHVTITLVLIAFVLLAAYGGPPGRIKPAVRHPMVVGTIVWAIGHLVANGTLADLVLFGAVLAWAVFDLVSLLARDRAVGRIPVAGPPVNDAVAIGLGVLLWAFFLFIGHRWLFGVSPLG